MVTNMYRRWKIWALLLAILCMTGGARAQHVYYQMVDETGNVVYDTGWKIRVGDEFLTHDNKRYEITRIEGNRARVRLIGQERLVEALPVEKQRRLWKGIIGPGIARAEARKMVAIYHTHNDEAYVPSDGTESAEDGRGGILRVGDAFGQALEKNGLAVVHSENSHIPHDDMAYERSRRTVVSLLKQQPAAVFDLHRDATPPEAYRGEIGGEDVTKVQLVVGKYGPTSKQIEEYALQMKAASDNLHPGLVKGIFFAKGGDYNQDLHPKSMLVEVGAHTNSREAAERGVALFADAIPVVLQVSSANPSNINGAAGIGTEASGPSGSMKSIGWMVGVAGVGALLFLFLSTGSVQEAKAKWKRFTHREFTNFLGFTKRRKK